MEKIYIIGTHIVDLTNAEYSILCSFRRKLEGIKSIDESDEEIAERLIKTYGGLLTDALLEAVYNFGYKV
jgi:hypothetical protein